MHFAFLVFCWGRLLRFVRGGIRGWSHTGVRSGGHLQHGLQPGSPKMPPRNRKRELLDATASYYHLPPSALLSPSKRPEIVIARWHYWTRLVCEAGYSLPMAGRATGGHNHASVLYGVRKYFSREIGIKVHTLDDARRAYYSGGYGDYADFWCANLRRIGLVVYPAPEMPVLEAAHPTLEAA